MYVEPSRTCTTMLVTPPAGPIFSAQMLRKYSMSLTSEPAWKLKVAHPPPGIETSSVPSPLASSAKANQEQDQRPSPAPPVGVIELPMVAPCVSLKLMRL